MSEVRTKLDMGFHKVILTITLLVFLIIAVALGGYLMEGGDPNVPVLGVMTFSVSFVLFALCVLTISIVIRTRDELHAMHEENKQQFHGVLHAVQSRNAGAKKKK